MADITYDKINWENEPSHNTPLSASNLNKMDTAIYDLVTKSNSLVPNPAESPTEGLEKLEYDGTVYEVKGGHKILNDSGSVLTQMDNMQFNGVYTHNASTITEVDIVREFSTVAEIEALTGEAQKGFQVVQDAEDYIPFTASENIFDNTNTSFTGDNVQDVLEEVDTALDDLSPKTILSIPANTYQTTRQALVALYNAFMTIPQAYRYRAKIVVRDQVQYSLCDLRNLAFTYTVTQLNMVASYSLYISSNSSNCYYLLGEIGSNSTTIYDRTDNTQSDKIDLII